MKAYYLFLDKHHVTILNGIKPREGSRGHHYIQLPVIAGLDPKKFIVPMDFRNPAVVTKNGKIHEIFLRIYGGTRFRDANITVAACAPKKATTQIVIFTSKRWPELGFQIIEGRPNGEFPGVQIMNEGDVIAFDHDGTKYQLTNSFGEPYLSQRKEKKVPQQKKTKPTKPTETVDLRQKIEGPTVVGKVDGIGKKPAEKTKQNDTYPTGGQNCCSNGGYTMGEVLKASGIQLPKG